MFVCSDRVMQCCVVVQLFMLWWDRVWCGVVWCSAFQWAVHLVQIGFSFVQLYAVMCVCCSVLFWLLQSSTVF